MLIGFHLVWTAYGFWLPNDPRGSMSSGVVVPEIAELGPHHYGRKKEQPPRKELLEFYDRAEPVLCHPLQKFDEEDVRVLSESFAKTIAERVYICYACAIMPDHVHLLIRKHRDRGEQMLESLQENSRVAMIESRRRGVEHPVWGGKGWKVFLRAREDMERTIHYIERNPVKIGRAIQCWNFVKRYDGWLPGRHPDAKR